MDEECAMCSIHTEEIFELLETIKILRDKIKLLESTIKLLQEAQQDGPQRG